MRRKIKTCEKDIGGRGRTVRKIWRKRETFENYIEVEDEEM